MQSTLADSTLEKVGVPCCRERCPFGHRLGLPSIGPRPKRTTTAIESLHGRQVAATDAPLSVVNNGYGSCPILSLYIGVIETLLSDRAEVTVDLNEVRQLLDSRQSAIIYLISTAWILQAGCSISPACQSDPFLTPSPF